MMQTFSRELAKAALPEGHWTDHLPDSSDDRGGATDICVDSAGRDTAYRLVPFTLTADVDTADVTNGDAVLKRAYDYLVGQGFDAGRSTPVLTAGRVVGERDGYIISLDLRTDWHQAVIEGLTPCVH